jgi:hypothetical protein
MKMINMYQKAFTEIIDFKNQYMEQVMQMRENFTKEREILQAYEEMRNQQKNEVQSLMAVS